MGYHIRVNPQDLEDSARQFQAESDNVNEQIGRLDSKMSNLQEMWQGEASQAFADRFVEHRGSLENMEILLAEIAEQLNSTAIALEGADRDIAGQISGM